MDNRSNKRSLCYRTAIKYYQGSIVIITEENKTKLSQSMERQLALLRELLANLVEEHHALVEENFRVLENVIADRIQLLSSFDRWNKQFVEIIFQLKNDEDLSLINKLTLFADNLLWLKKHLEALDVELILLVDQLLDILDLLRDENVNVLSFLEKKGEVESRFQQYVTKGPSSSPIPFIVAVVDAADEQP